MSRASAESGPFPGSNYVRVPTAPTIATILDAQGNPYRAPLDPLRTADKSHAARVFRDLAPSPSIEWQWTPEMIRGALAEHKAGIFARSAKLIEEMLGHDRIGSSLGARNGALLGLREVYRRSKADAGGECIAAWREAWPKCSAPVEQGDTVDEIRREALLAGFSVSEITWDTEVTPWQPYLKPWPLETIIRDPVRRCLIAMTEEGPVQVVPGDGRWFVHAPSGVYRGHLMGLVRPLALPWLLHCLARRDWARYSERHGMPIILAKTPAMADTIDKQRFETDLETMGTEAIAVLPQGIDGEGFDLDLLEAASQSWEGFDRMIIRCESSITIAIQWQNLTTEVKEGGMAAARTHGDVKQTAIVLDDRCWANDVQQQIARPFALWNYGDANKAPRTRRDLTVLEDKVANAQALLTFSQAVQSLRASGDPIDVAALARAHRIKLPMGSVKTEKPTIFGYHLAAGFIKVNEARARVGLDPIDGADGEKFVGGTPPPATGVVMP